MRRFWIDRSCLQNGRFVLKGDLFHHICRVSRIKPGEPFELFAEGSQKYKAALSSVSRAWAVADILEAFPVPPLKKPFVHLALAAPRPAKLDFIAEKAVELGVKELHLLISELSFLKKPSQLSSARSLRLRKIAESSLAQSGRTEPFLIHPPRPLKETAIPEGAMAFMGYEGEALKFLPDVLAEAPKTPDLKELWLFIGPEGGLSKKEAEDFAAKGGRLFSFGERILRVETACLAGLIILKSHYLKGF